ncbi:4-coumarate--CoA ligase 1-like [Homalodisca vitripennis]|uniref:4-coumarate--CoA ligase 1-like n=1 Tax=Homalodisca vitripennis TaxID=197043 RepID=UPI001EEB9D0B|nr:4-coumarate--CoA ligase 1-like [Homalodisca vitripennis]
MKKINPDQIALMEIETGRSLTYGELIHNAQSLACGLRWIGILPGQVVAVVSYNSLEAQTMILASLLVGSIAALMDVTLNAVDLSTQLRIITPHLLFSEGGKTLSKVEIAMKYMMTTKLPQIVVNSLHNKSKKYFAINQLMREVELNFKPEFRKANPLNPLFILFSSGTTGSAKGVLISERFFMNNRFFFESPYTVGMSHILLTSTPLFWISTLASLVLQFTKGLKTIFLRGSHSEAVLISALHKYKVSIWMTGPASLMDLWNWPVRPHYKHLKVILVSGMNFPVEHFIKVRDELFKGKVHVCEIYGLTETGVLTRSTPRLNKLGSVGEIVSNTKMKVVEEGTGFTLGAYQEGELCFKSQSLMLGYYKNPEATQLMFDSEGFFQTGDLGYYDSQGFVFITGRKKDIIKWRSYQISSSEVEAQLITLPEVREVVVFGIYDDKDGEHVTAAVILHPEFKDITPRELEKQANYHLSHSRKIRGGIHFFDTFPCTASGKPIKLLIAKEVLDRLHMREMECFDRCF